LIKRDEAHAVKGTDFKTIKKTCSSTNFESEPAKKNNTGSTNTKLPTIHKSTTCIKNTHQSQPQTISVTQHIHSNTYKTKYSQSQTTNKNKITSRCSVTKSNKSQLQYHVIIINTRFRNRISNLQTPNQPYPIPQPQIRI